MTGFPPKVCQRIAERASATGDAADAYCEVWEVCHGARSGPPHHRRPRGQGGSRRSDTNLPGNGLSCCPDCHEWIERNRVEAKSRGWLVDQGEPPASVPVLRRGTWVLLDDEGGVTFVADVVSQMRAAAATMRHVNLMHNHAEDMPMQPSWLEHAADVLEVPF